MRKFLLVALLIVSMAGLVQSHEVVHDPKDTFTTISIPVFNNSGGSLDAGDVVVWQFDSSTGDDDAYVTTTTTAGTSIVAGVVWPAAIADQADGSIVIYGVVTCDVANQGYSAHGPLCTTTSAGDGTSCASADTEAHAYAITTTSSESGSTIGCFVNAL